MKLKAKGKSGWLWRWTKRFFTATAAIVFTLAAVGAIYQFAATRADARKYPPRGKMVDVGDFKMHIYCAGEGSPTVVMDNGAGDGALDWNNVPREIAEFTRVCVYDRAGIGWSETSPAGRGVNQINRELHDLLQNAGEQKPFVFAGHSLGGLYLQNYANQYPEEVAGLVLIDSSHSEQTTRLGPPPLMLMRLLKIAAPFGLFRVMSNANENDSAERQERIALENSTKHISATADEMLAIEENSRILREKPMYLVDKPLIVLTRSLKVKSGDIENQIRKNEIWKQFQADLASRSTNNKHIIAENVGHRIHYGEPELVINAVRQVVEAVRK